MSSSPRAGRSRLLALAGSVAAAGLALAACSSSPSEPLPSPTPSVSGVLASPTPSPSESPVVARSLLSGRPDEVDGPVLVVKFDNTHNASPHAGLPDADVVYLEQVEFGLTRYAAVFSTRIPKELGPIRSARIADLELFPQYGKFAFAYSGAQNKLKPFIAAAPLYDVSGDKGATGYWRQPGRNAPYDFFGNGHTLLKRAPKAQTPRDVGFTFDDAVPAGGRDVKTVTAQWPGATALFTWSEKQGRWLLTMDGRQAMATDGSRLGGTTLILQYVDIYNSQFGDKFGGITPMSDTVGSGKALILRNGQAYDARWSRPSKEAGTTWTVDGEVLPLAAGQVWVALVKKGIKAKETHP